MLSWNLAAQSYSVALLFPLQSQSMHTFIRISLLCCLLPACASVGPLISGPQEFKTLITSDNIKRFELSVLPRPMHIDPQANRQKIEPGPSERQLLASLKATLASNGFCREGFLLLGRYAGESTQRLRGECKDSASAEDKSRFPNTIERW